MNLSVIVRASVNSAGGEPCAELCQHLRVSKGNVDIRRNQDESIKNTACSPSLTASGLYSLMHNFHMSDAFFHT